MIKWFNESGNEFLLAITAILSITVLAALKIISGELAAGIIAGAGGVKLMSLGGKKTITGLAIIGLGAGLLGGCYDVIPIDIIITSDPSVCAIETIYGGQPETEIVQTAQVISDHKMCSGALIASDLVLTAKHCGMPNIIDIWGAKYSVVDVVQCDYGDLELIQMDGHATYFSGRQIDPLQIYVGDLNVGDKLHISGWSMESQSNGDNDLIYPTGGDQEISYINENKL